MVKMVNLRSSNFGGLNLAQHPFFDTQLGLHKQKKKKYLTLIQIPMHEIMYEFLHLPSLEIITIQANNIFLYNGYQFIEKIFGALV